MPIAATFSFRDEAGLSLSDVAQLDTMVTVVDAMNFLREYASEDDLGARGMGVGAEDVRTLAGLLVAQAEFANVLVLSKTDLMTPEDNERLAALLHHLNPDARIVRASHGQVPLDQVLDTHLYDDVTAAASPGWLKELRGEHTPETEKLGIFSTVYRARRPFHPVRLSAFLARDWPGVLRSKGACRHRRAPRDPQGLERSVWGSATGARAHRDRDGRAAPRRGARSLLAYRRGDAWRAAHVAGFARSLRPVGRARRTL